MEEVQEVCYFTLLHFQVTDRLFSIDLKVLRVGAKMWRPQLSETPAEGGGQDVEVLTVLLVPVDDDEDDM